MKKIFFFLFAAILTLAASCNKENPSPVDQCPQPPDCKDKDPKQCRWEIFTCKVNGEDWCAACEIEPFSGCRPVDCQFYPGEGEGFNCNGLNKAETIGVNFLVSKDWGGLKIGKNKLCHSESNYIYKESNCGFYLIDTISYLTVLDIDIEFKFIEANFEFIAIDTICKDTVEITDGYFKLTYRP